MNKFMSLMIGLALWSVAMTGTTEAANFDGSDPLGSTGGVVPTPGDTLLTADVFLIENPFANEGSVDFAPVPDFTLLVQDPLTIDFNNLAGLVLGSHNFGTFTASSATLLTRTSNFAQVILFGLFDNSSTFGVGNPFVYTNFTSVGGEPASLRYSMTRSDDSISWSGTLSLPPEVVPEPSTFVLAGLGLLGLGCVALRKKYRRV